MLRTLLRAVRKMSLFLLLTFSYRCVNRSPGMANLGGSRRRSTVVNTKVSRWTLWWSCAPKPLLSCTRSTPIYSAGICVLATPWKKSVTDSTDLGWWQKPKGFSISVTSVRALCHSSLHLAPLLQVPIIGVPFQVDWDGSHRATAKVHLKS